jgi:hypothetical protein
LAHACANGAPQFKQNFAFVGLSRWHPMHCNGALNRDDNYGSDFAGPAGQGERIWGSFDAAIGSTVDLKRP